MIVIYTDGIILLCSHDRYYEIYQKEMALKNSIIGNEKAAEILEKNFKLDKLSHAYLFEGPDYVEKKTLALNFCRLVLCDKRNNIEKNVNLTIIKRNEDEKFITIEKIRELTRALSLYPYLSKRKAAIIEEAERMSSSAANALLKTLEEPNETTILILLSSNSNKIPKTIKSRCQTIKFSIAKKKFLVSLLKKNNITNESEINQIVELCGYKPRKIIEFLNDRNKIEELKKAADDFFQISKESEHKRLKKAEIASNKNISEIIEMLDLWTVYLRKFILEKYKRNHNQKYDFIGAKKKIDIVIKTKEILMSENVNVRLVLENLFLKI